MPNDVDASEVISALSYVPAEDRDTWVKMAFAVRGALGNEYGFQVWESWSKTASSYNAASARNVWRGAQPRAAGITVGTLFHVAKLYGWQPSTPARPMPVSTAQAPAPKREKTYEESCADARRLLMECEPLPGHPYLAKKGFPDHFGLVHKKTGNLVVPMRHYGTNALQTAQTISPTSEKKYLPGGHAKDSCFAMGRGSQRWLVEGYATGLSVWAALQALHRTDHSKVVVCFSDGGLKNLARPGDRIVADSDDHVCSHCKTRHFLPFDEILCPDCGSTLLQPAGERAAVATRQPYVLWEKHGDANDLHQEEGLQALVDLMLPLLVADPRAISALGGGRRRITGSNVMVSLNGKVLIGYDDSNDAETWFN